MLRLRRNWVAITTGVLLLSYAILVPAINSPAISAVDLTAVYQAPSDSHWFGTDQLGRDIWTRAAAALRISLVMSVVAAVFSTFLGALAAVIAVTAGRWVDHLVTRLIDALNAVPHLLLSVVILALWPGQVWAIILSIALTHWTQTARVLRAKLLTERESGYVKLSLASGARPLALWRTHLLPAVLPQAAIAFGLQIPHAMWHESALSFLGVGLPAQSASLGLLLEDARGGILSGAWWLLVFPASMLVLACWVVSAVITHKELVQPPQGSNSKALLHPPAATCASAESNDREIHLQATVASATETLVKSANLSLSKGKILAILGESGAGKTLFLRAITGLLPANLSAETSLTVEGQTYDNATSAKLLGAQFVYIPGSAATALNPVHTLGAALKRTFRQHSLPSDDDHLVAYLKEFDLGPHVLHHHPHQLSGGQAQRAVLALGLVSNPGIVLLDEPTSALDSNTRNVVANVLRGAAKRGSSVVMVTHDLELANELADEILVMEQGQLQARNVSTNDIGVVQ